MRKNTKEDFYADTDRYQSLAVCALSSAELSEIKNSAMKHIKLILNENYGAYGGDPKFAFYGFEVFGYRLR